ncbi:TlpA family protein disulfide reductase [Cupriavidus taiwanensis]|uniref:Putative disulfite reductase/thioredoxin, putative soxW homolog n=1 Tax=Cupriavidus taiwanensis TaxID=164546 RepID=A0A7Z7J700_9BURK|nr:TlpA disulfide reductase family protein [Cupriavidus taiwanensis]SOY90022.1 putative disulfite reductase/thioredoxin, putative soxW homolog [Cupriavidus taiwanensis]SOZ00508.1 putative disulfite reductase/thioredoxin, putative soxW homolog [Cupriavidus taiwanensis]SOZ03610.1 putative disulfite reductase/thioredoxin, putative soxW homolog [Cupriavidus taiwanensis]SPC07849.1 putative disulfite reductase/thioredoxin, putative soxW homolog [Cupriavidus taiwanensis]SPD42184.1 putative disulfite 
MRAPAMLLRALLAAGLVMAAAGAAALEVGDTVRLPEVRTLDGRTLSAAALAGKPLVVEYWATWCPFCAMQNPRLQKLYERTRGTPLQVLAISIDKDPREPADYMNKRGYTFPATMDSPALQAVFGKRKGLPELYVIDARGRVVQKEVGEMLEDDVAALERYAKP